jgi:hypothetical protein
MPVYPTEVQHRERLPEQSRHSRARACSRAEGRPLAPGLAATAATDDSEQGAVDRRVVSAEPEVRRIQGSDARLQKSEPVYAEPVGAEGGGPPLGGSSAAGSSHDRDVANPIAGRRAGLRTNAIVRPGAPPGCSGSRRKERRGCFTPLAVTRAT